MVNEGFQDKVLHCRDCSNEFLFSVGEQEFFATKGYVNEPTRCLTCRAANRARLNGSSGHASTREMHSVICADCGSQTQVPFLPRLEKPVYCSACFDRVRTMAPPVAVS